jgi:hypothetical protein
MLRKLEFDGIWPFGGWPIVWKNRQRDVQKAWLWRLWDYEFEREVEKA